MPWRQAKDRALLRVAGEDPRGFLQDLVSNDVSAAGPDHLVYAALLTPQGKYLADFFVFEREGAIMLDAAATQAAGLAQRLTLYKLRRALTIEPDPTPIWQIWDSDAPPEGALPDPRAPELGWRLYGDWSPEGEADDAGYEALRLRLAAPDSGRDLIANDTYILEAGFERLNGVDFRKGCYVGQEIVARMKHKTELRKGLVQVQVQGEAEPGAPLVAADGKPAGALLTHQNGLGLAQVRFDRAQGEMTAGAATVILK